MPISESTLLYRKNNNLCERCGNTNAIGKKLCDKHLKQASFKSTERRKKAKDKGLCVHCQKTAAVPGFSYCEKCREYGRQSSKLRNDARYKYRKENNLCTSCGKELDNDTRHCDICLENKRQQTKIIRDQRRDQKLCILCGKEPIKSGGKTYCEPCSQRRSKWYSQSETRLKNLERIRAEKNQVFNHYGSQCSCCGENMFEFLEIDHINNDGSKHRKQINKYGSTFYGWLIENDFPEGFQVLCKNCNIGKHRNGGICPHQQDKVNYDPLPENPKHTGAIK